MASIITQISGGFESLNDDTLGLILEFVGKKSYYAYGATNKRCREIYLSKEWSNKETFLYGYAPLAVIQEKCTRLVVRRNRFSVGYGVLFYNRRDVLEWAFTHPGTLNQIFSAAVKVGRLDICNEIHDRSTEGLLRVHARILSFVAFKGKLDTLKWLDARSYLGSSKIRRCAIDAAEGGHLNILLWLQTKNPFDERLKHYCTYSAARGGKLNVLEWLKDNGFSFDVNNFGAAAYGGHKHVLEWLKDNSFSCNKFTFGAAALGGHLRVLEWLRDNNCPWDKCCYKCAAKGGYLHVLDWLRDNECPRGNANIYLHKEKFRDDVVIWLHNNGFSISRLSL